MARQKRSSRVLDKAESRLTGVQSIDEKLVLNKQLTAQAYGAHINTLTHKLNAYNKALADVDALQIEVDEAEDFLSNYSEQMLMGVGAEFGKNSAEYERAGGVRKSDRKRPTRRAAVAVS
ncbi:MAG: hypothetical protein DCF25_15290 [Leptolyngbya foveolarum]|uniref:Uncharacterized protein n=1 Tax=Leptolyngbya foveolarum TaxID=47253 RepID=A0A2W4TZ97_9CYAN|nr:MAG: hypothetical protein DCF25_15290 [Leptolyngbya foveolarum]